LTAKSICCKIKIPKLDKGNQMRINPLAKAVLETFDAIYAQTTNFVLHPESAINGLIVSGDAGTGKTYTVKKALIDNHHQVNVEMIKGGKMTAASLYVKLFLNRDRGRIIVIDDCDIIHHAEKRQIIPMLLGAVELGQGGEVSWETAKPNALMQEYNVPHNFTFQGSLIWITNDRKQDLAKSVKQWKSALLSRFNFAECNFTTEQKFMYTLHLIENEDMLGKKCQVYPGGYPPEIIEQCLDYLTQHYLSLVEVTPRQACKVADILHHNKDQTLRRSMLQQLWK